MWYRLRAGRLDGLKFLRQHPVSPYVADFYCQACKLVVELDGSQHDHQTDRQRTRVLEERSLKVLRFRDNEVLQQMDAVLEVILRTAPDRTLTPTPLPEGEGLKSKER
ncbi:endonuclease domain-containing protein [Frateuria terrea]|uniref:Very-short-patch-repair endonuclease n=1 Tax=Frateuria terrea TaxID=529704 RepID=A0A1H6VKH2_9GAMM|nr:endonuclease domain-containing protein [Frateuria terrea]SEJ04166.1 Very-short-patch-repair endonuclease [Frateuria terrea]SFP63509.1 Very-short-patch-repair endonuclease [Frateuria terrea]